MIVKAINAGSVGIGTTAPQNTLDVTGAVTVSKGLNASNLNVTGFSITDDSLVTLADGSKKKIKDIKAGDEVLTLEESSGKLVPRKVNALLDHGIKPIYEMATEDGRAINTTAEHPYFVKLYNEELCDKYANNVWNKNLDNNEFNEKGYCTRWVEVRDLEEGDYIAVPRIENLNKQNIQSSPFNNLSINSRVVNTLTNDCCLRCGSLDQIGDLIANASARYGESSLSGRTETDFSSNSSYSKWLQNLILSSTSSCHSSNSCSESFDLDKHSDICLFISDSMYSGAKNLALSVKNKYEATESGFIIENFIFASNTILIISPYLFINFSLISGESLASNDLNASFLTFLPKPTDHLVNSFSSLESSFLRNASSSDFLCVLTSNSSIIECSSLSTSFNFSMINDSSINITSEIDELELYKTFYEESDSDIKFERISSIEVLEPQHVYDLSIEGTRNFIANDIVAHNTYLATSSGNVGIGTASPQNALDVVGAVTVSKGLNASNLNVTGFSITDDSLVTLSDGTKKKIKDIRVGEEVLTLEESSGKLVPRKVNALLDHGIKPIYEMATESGRAINTTAEHPYYVRTHQSASEKLSSLTTQVLPSISSESFSKNFDTGGSSLENTGGCMRKTTIKGNFDGGNNEVFKKSLSRDNIALDSLHANEYSLEFLMPFSAYLISMPLSERDLINLASTSSSEKNLNFDINESFPRQSFSCIMQSSLDMPLGQGRISLNDILKTFSSFKHFQNSMDRDPGAFERGLSVADFAVSNDKLINFGSHNINNDNSIFKSYGKTEQNDKLGEWIEVRYLKAGDEIAVPDYSSNTIKWEKIASIRTLEPQHVYDLSIEGTRNFIANDIVAHNTYLATDSGKVGIGTTAPNAKLVVIGGANISGGLNVTAGNVLLATASGNVGIGTASPDNTLTVNGDANIADGNGLIVGHTGQLTVGSLIPETQILGTAIADSSLVLGAYSTTNSVEPQLRFVKADATAIGTATNGLLNGENMGAIVWFGDDDADVNSAGASIAAYVDGTRSGGADDMRARLVFSTTAPLGNTVTERMRIDSAGNVGIGTTSPQNALDVVGAVTVSKGLNASNLNVTGFSITDDSLVTVVEFEEENKEENEKSLNQAETIQPEVNMDSNKYINLLVSSQSCIIPKLVLTSIVYRWFLKFIKAIHLLLIPLFVN